MDYGYIVILNDLIMIPICIRELVFISLAKFLLSVHLQIFVWNSWCFKIMLYERVDTIFIWLDSIDANPDVLLPPVWEFSCSCRLPYPSARIHHGTWTLTSFHYSLKCMIYVQSSILSCFQNDVGCRNQLLESSVYAWILLTFMNYYRFPILDLFGISFICHFLRKMTSYITTLSNAPHKSCYG